ncbi:MAG: 2,3,4,5-tetrahydropyridine-2,6-dicarboxylate N-succinyltransferase [Candidatus Lightella neohaematopini]|nr:2,3,4,5-tetrahydropyridine-2,6-dicarboxylate N-succinyltransferase [Candidatus Lightella neohaematopini]
MNNTFKYLENKINNIFYNYKNNNFISFRTKEQNLIKKVVSLLDLGILRVSIKLNNKKWITFDWIKKALLLYFRINKSKLNNVNKLKYFDKIPLKFNNWNFNKFSNLNIRVVPLANVRYGAYIAKNTVIMPSYINIGAFIDEGTMIDTWATIGSCAQIGKNVHISGGVGIGGVLEPINNNPTIIEDNCFIGARSEIVEGVIVEESSVISMGVFIGKSTKIYNKNTNTISYGRIPAKSVVVPGNLPSKDGKYSVYCAIIIKKVDDKTKKKIQLNNILRT